MIPPAFRDATLMLEHQYYDSPSTENTMLGSLSQIAVFVASGIFALLVVRVASTKFIAWRRAKHDLELEHIV